MNIKGTQYELLLVDTAGQDEYSMFPAEYSVDVNGYVLVYSIDSVHSFEVCKSIHEKLMDLVGGSVPIILVGNKTDLHVDRRVTQAQGKALAEEMKAVFIETSAKENQVSLIHNNVSSIRYTHRRRKYERCSPNSVRPMSYFGSIWKLYV